MAARRMMYHLSSPSVVEGKDVSMVRNRAVVSPSVGVVRAILDCGFIRPSLLFRSSFGPGVQEVEDAVCQLGCLILRLRRHIKQACLYMQTGTMISILQAEKTDPTVVPSARTQW